MHFHGSLAALESQIYSVVENFGVENISLLSGRLVRFPFPKKNKGLSFRRRLFHPQFLPIATRIAGTYFTLGLDVNLSVIVRYIMDEQECLLFPISFYHVTWKPSRNNTMSSKILFFHSKKSLHRKISILGNIRLSRYKKNITALLVCFPPPQIYLGEENHNRCCVFCPNFAKSPLLFICPITLYPNVYRYIRCKLRFTKGETEVRKCCAIS